MIDVWFFPFPQAITQPEAHKQLMEHLSMTNKNEDIAKHQMKNIKINQFANHPFIDHAVNQTNAINHTQSRVKSEAVEDAERIARDAKAIAERVRIRNAILDDANNNKILSQHIKEQSTINLIKQEEKHVLMCLREILRVPDGESIITHAKIVRSLADALIATQK